MLGLLYLLIFSCLIVGAMTISVAIAWAIRFTVRKMQGGRFVQWLSNLPVIKIAVAIFPISLFFIIAIDRGHKIEGRNGSNYYKNIKGIRYDSNYSPIPDNLRTTGSSGYLKGVDEASFVVLGEMYAKDCKHVWFQSYLMQGVDVASFDVDKSGLAKDKNWVYVGLERLNVKMDVESAEFFIRQEEYWHGMEWSFIRDCNHVYYRGTKTYADRNTFRPLRNDYYIDKDSIYYALDSLHTIDALHDKPENLEYHYGCIKNGNTIIRGRMVRKILIECKRDTLDSAS